MIVACVWNGDKYGPEYVIRLKRMVEKHLSYEHRFVCITNDNLPSIDCLHPLMDLPGWWMKMNLFDPIWRMGDRVLYFDLDTVIVGSLDPLAKLRLTFGICGNFTRAAGNLDWPCRYGSCVMTISPNFGGNIWAQFSQHSTAWMQKAGKFGDQWVIEQLEPNATILQDLFLPGYFVGYRDLTKEKPEDAAVIVFAGRQKPHNCKLDWVRTSWEL